MQQALAPLDTADHEVDDGTGSQSWGEYLRSLSRVDPSSLLDQMKAPRGRQAKRRRTVVLSLSAGFGVALLGAVVGVVPGFAAVMIGLLLAGYLSAMFLQMRQWETRATGDPAPVAPTWSRTAPAASGSAPAVPSDGVRVVQGTQAVGSSWEPRETTLPTYVSKSKASKIPRRIDLTRDGWTGAGMVEQARQQQASPQLQSQFDREFAALEPSGDSEVDAYANNQVDRYYRRAVNE
jgi:hypothetical protein